MTMYLYKSQVLCEKCLVKSGIPLAHVYKLDGEMGDVVCANCGDVASKEYLAGAVVSEGEKSYVYCRNCMVETVLSKSSEGKQQEIQPILKDVPVHAPVFCDKCGSPLSIRLSPLARISLKKSIKALEIILDDENIRDTRPSLWKWAYDEKARLDDVLLSLPDAAEVEADEKK